MLLMNKCHEIAEVYQNFIPNLRISLKDKNYQNCLKQKRHETDQIHQTIANDHKLMKCSESKQNAINWLKWS